MSFGEDWLPRVELTLRSSDERQRDLHLYEVHWATLAEGKVTARDAIAFLTGAALRGIRYCAHGSFYRWMIVSYANRPRRWINIWSPFDWVSGSLEYYDAPESSDRAPGADTSDVDIFGATSAPDRSDIDILPSGSSAALSAADSSVAASAADLPSSDHSSAARRPGEVENIRERGVPLDTVRAHLGYWKRGELGRRLFEAITDREAAGTGRAPGWVGAEEARLPVSAPVRHAASPWTSRGSRQAPKAMAEPAGNRRSCTVASRNCNWYIGMRPTAHGVRTRSEQHLRGLHFATASFFVSARVAHGDHESFV